MFWTVLCIVPFIESCHSRKGHGDRIKLFKSLRKVFFGRTRVYSYNYMSASCCFRSPKIALCGSGANCHYRL
uniref:Putative secreted protein n=1 Tax=Anopheles marajoara TaxID=58244 RepID=A0A2M4CF42_9DIPT